MRTLIVSSALVLLSIGMARAEDVRTSCMPDVKTLCAGIKPGGGAIRACMRAHRTELSQGCKLAIADRMLSREPHAETPK